MSVKIKHGVDPIGTEHFIKMQTPQGLTEYKYRVHNATGLERHLPTSEPVLYFEYHDVRKPDYPQRFFSLPLSSVHIFCRPETEGDQFWEFEKQSA